MRFSHSFYYIFHGRVYGFWWLNVRHFHVVFYEPSDVASIFDWHVVFMNFWCFNFFDSHVIFCEFDALSFFDCHGRFLWTFFHGRKIIYFFRKAKMVFCFLGWKSLFILKNRANEARLGKSRFVVSTNAGTKCFDFRHGDDCWITFVLTFVMVTIAESLCFSHILYSIFS